ncbi:hypothetical protein EV126DRAFT_412193, partial [Verticillium dahliae]
MWSWTLSPCSLSALTRSLRAPWWINGARETSHIAHSAHLWSGPDLPFALEVHYLYAPSWHWQALRRQPVGTCAKV